MNYATILWLMHANRELAGDRLSTYRAKRSPEKTPEPFGDQQLRRPGIFVVQKHAARALHYDLRLELGGVLLSWAVPKGPSACTEEKRLAIQTEDHPLEYSDFEGLIPEGSYGAGAMIVWDRGRWIPVEDPEEGLKKGKLWFELRGYKLRGFWTLVRTKRNDREWLLIKKPDEWARSLEDAGFSEESIFSGLSVEELAEGPRTASKMQAELDEMGVQRDVVDFLKLEIMLAETVEKPFDSKAWFFELKYDGYRLLAGKDQERVRLRYRSGRDATKLYPEITRAVAGLPFSEFILDGELVVADMEGKPSFQLLQRRAHRASSTELEQLALESPATFWVFDLVYFDGFDLRGLPLELRKQLLQRMLPKAGPVRYVDHFEARGKKIFAQVERLGLEGVVAKEASSVYKAGRHRQWRKIHALTTADFVIVGFTEPKKSRAGFGALHLAGFDGSELVYAGRVGTGFTQEELGQIRGLLDPLVREEPRFSGASPTGTEHIWVEPELVATVRFKEWTEAGQLRQPRYVSLKTGKACEECFLPGAEATREIKEPVRRPAGPVERIVKFTNETKVLWPEEGYTKGDLIEYYRSVSPWILPYLKDRLVVLDRYPDGIEGKSFFQKNAPEFTPDWIRTEQLWSKEDSQGSNYFVCEDEPSLLYLANLASIPLHVWSSRAESLHYPDWCVLDLDPTNVPFREVVHVAQVIGELCEETGVESFVKTSGGKGLHVLVPLGGCTFEQSRLLAELLARITLAQLPEITTIDRRLEQREGKIYLDYIQNGYGKLLVAPFSARPYPAAPVSTPLRWNEVTEKLDPLSFTIKSVPLRMNELNEDPLCGILRGKTDLGKVISVLGDKIRDMV